MKPAKKMTLDQAVAETGVALHNSNMTNAAHAIVAIEQYRLRLASAEKAMREAAEDPATSFEDFKKAYDHVMRLVDRV